jgi:CrcB protein
MTAVLVALAGGLGAALRFVVDGLVARLNRFRLPLGTTVVNVSGSFLLGLLTGWALTHSGHRELTLILGTGLLGGYTTFSTASVEAVRLAGLSRSGLLAVGHAAGMLVLSLASAGLGLWLARV